MINQTKNNRALFGLMSFGISGTSFFICLALLLGSGIAAGQTAQPTPLTPTPTPGEIKLSARGYKVKGQHTVDLTWPGGTSSDVDIYRDGVLIATMPNIPGFYTDHIGAKGRRTYTYKVCEAGSQNCYNEVTVRFDGGG
jgi:serine protease